MISVILCTYNRANLVLESIESVLQQTHPDFELVIVDDGSSDNTRELIALIPDTRIKYHYLPHSGYTGRLKNFALRQAQGDYIAFIDSDDLWKPDKLERQLAMFNMNPSIGFSITDVTTFRKSQVLIDHSYNKQHTTECRNIFDWLKNSRFLIYNPTLVIRRECFKLTGYFDETMRSGDFHFNMRLAHYFDAGIIYETLVLRRVHDHNMSEQIPIENYTEFIDTFTYLYNQQLIEKKYLLNAKATAFYKMGKLYAEKGEHQQARRHFIRALKNDPLKKEGYWRLALSIFGRK